MIENFERVNAGQRAFLLLDLSSVVVSFSVPDSAGRTTRDRAAGRGDLRRAVGPAIRGINPQDRLDGRRPDEDLFGRGPGRPARGAQARDGRHPRTSARERRAFLLPLTAVAAGEGRTIAVYRVSSEGGKSVARRVPVGFDDVIDNRLAVRLDPETADGLRPGDLVVATGVHRLRDGEVVKVAE